MNDWGITVAAEIVVSTEAYLEAHPYAEPERLVCIGASYRGFMTMLLTTRTWGEGDWGFASSAAATAKSYLWNRPDIYIDQSPLVVAGKVVTPLLLHGAIDNNVPPGASEQMYTALRVLGKELEYIRIDDELNWSLQYDRRQRWSESIVARFEKHLKDDAAWWRHLWPEDE